MSIKAAYMLPHPPIIVPEIGKPAASGYSAGCPPDCLAGYLSGCSVGRLPGCSAERLPDCSAGCSGDTTFLIILASITGVGIIGVAIVVFMNIRR